MPATMRQLAPVQLLTWLGLFCMWLYFPVAVARNVFGAAGPEFAYLHARRGVGRSLLRRCTRWCASDFRSSCRSWRKAVGRKHTHSLCLLCGALGLVSVAVIHDKNLLLLSMVGVGIAWASTLSMPYSVLAGSLPAEKTGVYMGIFNFFIVLPEIIASLGFGWVMNHF